MTDEHDAYGDHRKSSLYWLRYAQEGLENLERIEGLLPSFVRRRYIIQSLGSSYLHLAPVDVGDGVVAADALHADVNKLFVFMLKKREAGEGPDPTPPARGLASHDGTIHYEFTLTKLPGFESLRVFVGGLPAGSACRITRKVTGTRLVETVAYEMECDDDADMEAQP